MWPKSQDWNSQKHRRKKLGKHFFFPNFCSDKSSWKDHSCFTHSWVHWRKEARSWARKTQHHSSRETGPLEQLRMKSALWGHSPLTAVASQEFVSCIPHFSTAWNTGHQISFQISNNHSHTDSGDGSPPPWGLHAGYIDAVASSPAVTTGWQCWRGSAEPTTLPDLWVQSLQHNKNTELTMKFM